MTDQDTTQRQKGFVNVITAFVANTQSSFLMKPRQGTFDNPTKCTQSAAMFGSTFGQDRLDTHLPQCLTMGFRVITAIALDAIRTVAGATRLSCDSRNCINQR